MNIGRWFLRLKVLVFRALMSFGMKFHRNADPKAPQPNFRVVIPSRLSTKSGQFELVFYVPDKYFQAPDGHKYPVVVNFHGGGFVLGSATDDARWASSVLKYVDAVFVSVEYRLAPEFPFSVAVEDGCDAIVYLVSHAEELHLDPNRIGITGFSAGGNLAFTIPLMLWDLRNNMGKRQLQRSNDLEILHINTSKLILSAAKTVYKYTDFQTTDLETKQIFPEFTIRCIVSFYPVLDFRQPRAEKQLTNRKPEKNLPTFLVNIFDESYKYPRDKVDNNDPYLSPVAASNDFLKAAYPEHIVLFTCEYDMLNAEGIAFKERLSNEIGKSVYGGLIEGVAHGFDKNPYPAKGLKTTEECYMKACADLAKTFENNFLVEKTQVDNESTNDGITK